MKKQDPSLRLIQHILDSGVLAKHPSAEAADRAGINRRFPHQCHLLRSIARRSPQDGVRPSNNYYRQSTFLRSPDRASGIDRSPPPIEVTVVSDVRAKHPKNARLPTSRDGCFATVLAKHPSAEAACGQTAQVVLTAGLHLTDGCHRVVSDVGAKHPKISALPALMRAVWMLRPYQ